MTEATWMVVELMGRKVVAGLVREEIRFGTPWMRIDIPDVPGQPGFTSYYGASSLYGFRPVDEATARAVAAKLREPPVEPWRLAQLGPGSAHDSVRPGEDDEVDAQDEQWCEHCGANLDEDGNCLDCARAMTPKWSGDDPTGERATDYSECLSPGPREGGDDFEAEMVAEGQASDARLAELRPEDLPGNTDDDDLPF